MSDLRRRNPYKEILDEEGIIIVRLIS